jgi:hypothetical protein
VTDRLLAFKRDLLAIVEEEEARRREQGRRLAAEEEAERSAQAEEWERRRCIQAKMMADRRRLVQVEQGVRLAATENARQEEEKRIQFLNSYRLFSEIYHRGRAAGNIKKTRNFMDTMHFPFNRFSYTKEEEAAMPAVSYDLPNVEWMLKAGLWPFAPSEVESLVDLFAYIA